MNKPYAITHISKLKGKTNVSNCTLSSETPLLTLSDGRAYMYSLDLGTWILLTNPLDPLSRASGALTRGVSVNLPLASLQKGMPSHLKNESLPSGVTLSFLESQLIASSVLRSATEFRHWLLATVNHLLEKGPECRLRSILDDLIGPIHSSSKESSKAYDIMGLSKKKLLNEILSLIKMKLPWQRLYKEYSEQLTLVNESL